MFILLNSTEWTPVGRRLAPGRVRLSLIDTADHLSLSYCMLDWSVWLGVSIREEGKCEEGQRIRRSCSRCLCEVAKKEVEWQQSWWVTSCLVWLAFPTAISLSLSLAPLPPWRTTLLSAQPIFIYLYPGLLLLWLLLLKNIYFLFMQPRLFRSARMIVWTK